MDEQRFDALAKAAAAAPRRRVLAGLVGALAAALGPRRAGAQALCPNQLCAGAGGGPCPATCVCVVYANRNNRCLAPGRTPCAAGQTFCGGRCRATCTGAATLDPATCGCLCPPGHDLCGDETQTTCCPASGEPVITG